MIQKKRNDALFLLDQSFSVSGLFLIFISMDIVNERIKEFNLRNKEKIFTTLKDKSNFGEKGTLVEVYLQQNNVASLGQTI